MIFCYQLAPLLPLNTDHITPITKSDSRILGSMEPQVISAGDPYLTLPRSYDRLEPQRPNLSQLPDDVIIDVSCPDRDLVILQSAHACSQFGNSQEINHGEKQDIMDKMVGMVKEFPSLPAEEKMKLSASSDPAKDKIHNWRDYLRLHSHPLGDQVHELPTNPPSLKEERAIFINFQEAMIYVVAPLLGLVTLKYQSNPNALFHEYVLQLWCFILSTCIYWFIIQPVRQILLDTDCNSFRVLTRVEPAFALLPVLSLLSMLLPSHVAFVTLLLWALVPVVLAWPLYCLAYTWACIFIDKLLYACDKVRAGIDTMCATFGVKEGENLPEKQRPSV